MAFSFKNLFGVDEYYEENENQSEEFVDEGTSTDNNTNPNVANASATRPAATRRPNVLNMDGQREAASKIALYEPRIFSDAKAIVQQVLAGEAVIVNFASIDETQARRIIDFMSGAAEAVEGDVTRIGERIFLFTPKSFKISGAVSQNLTQQFS